MDTSAPKYLTEGESQNSIYCSIGFSQPAPPYYSAVAYQPAPYEPSSFSGVTPTPCVAAAHPVFNSQATEFCDLDLLYPQTLEQAVAPREPRRDSFSSASESSSSTGSPPPPAQTPYAHMSTYAGYSTYTGSGSGAGTSRSPAASSHTHRRQNKKDRLILMEEEERVLTQKNNDLRRILQKLQRNYGFLEQRVKSQMLHGRQQGVVL